MLLCSVFTSELWSEYNYLHFTMNISWNLFRGDEIGALLLIFLGCCHHHQQSVWLPTSLMRKMEGEGTWVSWEEIQIQWKWVGPRAEFLSHLRINSSLGTSSYQRFIICTNNLHPVCVLSSYHTPPSQMHMLVFLKIMVNICHLWIYVWLCHKCSLSSLFPYSPCF